MSGGRQGQMLLPGARPFEADFMYEWFDPDSKTDETCIHHHRRLSRVFHSSVSHDDASNFSVVFDRDRRRRYRYTSY